MGALLATESQRHHRSTLRTHLLPAFGAKPLAVIDLAALQEFVASLNQLSRSRSTIEAVRNLALQILRHARASGFAAHTITRAAVKLPSEQRAPRERRHIKPDELIRILEASEFPTRALWAILAYAGARIGEALALTWSDIDLTAELVRIRRNCVAGVIGPLKTRSSSADVPMLPELHAILTEYRAHRTGQAQELLFASRHGTPLRSDDVRRRWLQPLLKRLAIAPAGCHAFRHSLPGRLDELTLSPAAIQKFMRHSTLSMTESYLHRSSSDVREQLAAARVRRDRQQHVSA